MFIENEIPRIKMKLKQLIKASKGWVTNLLGKIKVGEKRDQRALSYVPIKTNPKRRRNDRL